MGLGDLAGERPVSSADDLPGLDGLGGADDDVEADDVEDLPGLK